MIPDLSSILGAKMEDTKEISFLTKRALATFTRPIAVWHSKTVMMMDACFVEFTEQQNNRLDYESMPRQVRIIKFGNGPKLEKSILINLSSFGGVFAIQIIEDTEEI